MRLTRSGNLIEIKPVPDGLVDELSYNRVKLDFGFNANGRELIVEKLLCVKGGAGYFPAGLLKRTLAFLHKRRLVYEYVDMRDVNELFPDPDLMVMEKLRPGQDKVIEAVCCEDGGVIVCNTAFGKSFCVRQICKIYPTLRIVVCSPGRDDVRALYEKIKPDHPAGAVGLMGAGSSCRPSTRIVVSTAKSLIKTDLDHCQLLLFDEVHSCGFNQVAETLATVHKARMFGFTATPDGRSDGAEMVIEALFGPPVANWEYQESVAQGTAVPLEVHWTDVTGPSLPSSMAVSKATMKRKAYWRNVDRNQKIADIANSFPPEMQLLIIVETVEHAMHLKRLLPDYALVYASADDYQDYVDKGFTTEERLNPKKRDELRDRFSRGELKRAICTTVWKQAVDFPQLAVLIRADGAPGKIPSGQIPGRLSRISEGKEKGILIDFVDNFDTWAARRAALRLRSYREKGWTILRK